MPDPIKEDPRKPPHVAAVVEKKVVEKAKEVKAKQPVKKKK